MYFLNIFVILLPAIVDALSSTCSSKSTCDLCIQDSNCDWCFKPLQYGSIHCFDVRNESKLCPKSKSYNFKPHFDPIFQSRQSFKPSFVTLMLRINVGFNLIVNYTQPRNYPLDLYYLMDLSATMKKHKDKLERLSSDLAKVMKNLTMDFRLGFGSFVDKNVLPFFESKNHDWMRKKCERNNSIVPCVKATYSFENHLSLTENWQQFANSVSKTEQSGNIDSPEGTLEALVQAVVCKEIIGWRNQSTHIIVVSTDDIFHIAGDGKLAGLIEPSNGHCVLNENGTLLNSVPYDYPSIGQINQIVQQNNVHVVFTVTNNVAEHYRKLSERIAGSSVAVLSDGSANVLDIIYNFYGNVTKSLNLNFEVSKSIIFEFFMKCKTNDQLLKRTSCYDIQVGDKIQISTNVTITECLSKPETRFILFDGLHDVLLLNVSSHCKCHCNTPDIRNECILSGKMCSNHGNCHCGKCECVEDYFGRYCELRKQRTGHTCAQLEPCIRCSRFENCTKMCPKFDYVKNFESNVDNFTICNYFNVSNGCSRNFYFDFNQNKLILDVLQTCINDQTNWVVLSIVSCIVATGLAMILVWKIFVKVSDSREYSQFEDAKQRTKWGLEMNPIFKGATNTFSNPLFRCHDQL